jgi:trans-aconitate 2-methyltransferase
VKPLDWDAKTYDTASAPVHTMGAAMLDELELRGDETVLDAGCGSGAVTAQLLERLPQGRVVAVDGSPQMVALARATLDPARAEVMVGDLLELELAEPVDVVFSSATFHWVPDHPRLFARLRSALKPGGRLRTQCGGAGNCAELYEVIFPLRDSEPYAAHIGGFSPWIFDSPDHAAAMMRAAGFTDVEAWPQTVDLTFDDVEGYLRSTQLPAFLERLPEALRDRFVADVRGRLPDPLPVRYVRTNLSAHRI